ncbi:sigma-70 family RNA polymerase sigma factor [Paenibacillus sp. LMG 31460]|uniref:Sigma-70 family RNA polymerase sigma factor n=1 Tax=Paenibacillus germinis TaxID=2654979 RepID=A0ABX1Z6L6_9BACL|nr:RNA polymerase sigma factor [Paenibacillus germinis]NOU89023.1 sigma-70 family RNA polymerase sigma factor [Paenibacillus germinis]
MVVQLLLQYETDLKNYCSMLTGTPWDADDLYQETHLKVMKAEQKFLHHPSPKALLFRIASNAWIDECRKRKADIGLPNNYESISLGVDMYSLDIKDCLEYLVATVPPFQAVAILLIDVFNYTSREVAEMLGNTEGSVKAALYRARKRLIALGVSEKGMYVQRNNTEERSLLINQFLEAFHLQEPMKIAEAYLRLTQVGIQTERHLILGKLFFTFRDPEGNAFTIIAEK